MSNEKYETIEDIVAEIRMLNPERFLVSKWCCEPLPNRMRSYAERINEAYKFEIETLRALIEGLLKASSVDCASCGYDCGPRRENCITKQAIAYLEGRRDEGLSAL